MDGSFSVIEDRWIKAVDKRGDNTLISLKEALENADIFSALSFPVPGEDLAVLRFLIALVYLYCEPKGFDEWKKIWKTGRFPEKLIKKIERDSDFFNTLDSEKPFMQVWEEREKKTRPVTALYKTLPGKTATLHFRHYSFSDQYALCVSCFLPALLSAHLYANSGGIAPKEKDGGRHFLAGINGSAPLFLWAEGTNLFETVWLNILCGEYQRNYVDRGFLRDANRWPEEWDRFEVTADEIGMTDGILWRPRGIRAFLEKNAGNEPCMVCGTVHDRIIREIDYRSGNHRLKEGSFWQDPMVARVHTQEGKITRTSLSGFQEAERSGWKDFASLTYQEKRIAKTQDGEKIYERMVVPVMGQLARLRITPKKWNIQCFIVDTPSQPPIRKYLYGSYIYRSEWIEEDEIQDLTRLLVRKTYNGENVLSKALRRAFGDEKKVPGFKEAYWQELEIPFADFLTTLEEYEGTVAERVWNKILAEHVDELYNRLTGSLYDNGSLLGNVIAGERIVRGYTKSLRNKEEMANERE